MPRVAVRGRDDEQHRRARRNPDAIVIDVFRGSASIGLDRTFVAQHLLDRGAQGALARPYLFESLRMAEKRVDAVADQVPRGLVSGDQQQYTLRVKLCRCELRLPCDLQHQIEKIARLLAVSLPYDRLEQCYQPPHSGLGRASRDGRSHRIAEPAREVVRERNALRMQGIGDAQKSRDHPHRQRMSEVADEIWLRHELELSK